MEERDPILNMPLNQVLHRQFALPLQQILQLYTVGHFLSAWQSPRCQRSIEQVFDDPRQAQQAAHVCAAWVGLESAPLPIRVQQWWADEHGGAVV
ncbi:MAG: hypothetical protein ACREJC_14640 [Tepidisphaeraceae bacterium]